MINNRLKESEKKIQEKNEKIKNAIQQQMEQAEAVYSEIKNSSMRKEIGFFSSLRFKMTLAFFIPVLMVIGLGIMSYSGASTALISSFEASTTSTIKSTADYFELIISNLSTASYDTVTSMTSRNYYGKLYKYDAYEEGIVAKALKTEIESRKTGNKFIKNIVFSTNYGEQMSTVVETQESVYEQFSQTELAKAVDQKDIIYVGYHNEVDQLMGTGDYAFSVIRKAYNKAFAQIGYLIVDADYSQISNTLASVDIGENSILAFITPDGREISYCNTGEAENDSLSQDYIVNSTFYSDVLTREENEGSEYVDFNGQQYLLIYNRFGYDGFMIVSLIPKSFIISDAKSIARTTTITVIITGIVVIVTGLFFSIKISRNIKEVMKGLANVAEGYLTTEVKVKSKDEFMVLCDSTNTMIKNMRDLLNKANQVSYSVREASESVANNATELLEETTAITNSINEVENGVVLQANDAENCLIIMDNLSKKIEAVTENTNKIAHIADNTKGIVSDGIVTMDELKNKVRATSDITAQVITDIEQLDEASGSIAKIVGVINDIADETSLLSLNASIEAARAGDAGRGFAVVADSIRKLADQSLESVNEIRAIVDKIQTQTVETVTTAKQAELIVSSQEEALKNTVDVFHSIDFHVSGLADNIIEITNDINEIDSAKNETLSAIESISAVSEETASAVTEVNAAAERQLEAVEKLNRESNELINNSGELVESINLFKI